MMSLREKAIAFVMLFLLNVVTLAFGATMGVLGLLLAASFLLLSAMACVKIAGL